MNKTALERQGLGPMYHFIGFSILQIDRRNSTDDSDGVFYD